MGLMNYLSGNEGWIPDAFTGGTPTKQALSNAYDYGADYMAGNQGLIPDIGGQTTAATLQGQADDVVDYFSGNQGLVPDALTGGTPTKEALGNLAFGENYMQGNEGMIPDRFTFGVPTKEALSNAAYYSGAGLVGGLPGMGVAGLMDYINDGSLGYADNAQRGGGANITGKSIDWYRQNLDMNDKGMIKDLQAKLGVTADGMFGPETEAAWRKAVGTNIDQDNRMANLGNKLLPGDPFQKQDALKYDYNQQALQQRMGNSKTKLGGKLKQAWTNLDEKMGGILPGGYNKDLSNMTAAEWEARNAK